MSGAVTERSGLCNPPTILHRECPDGQESEPRKKSRKSTIMEALRRGTSQTDGTSAPSRQMSTVAFVSESRSTTPGHQFHLESPTLATTQPISSTGLPFYSHAESLDSSSLPALPTSRLKYLRDMDQANYTVGQMIDRMEPFPGSRWRGVIGFDMEWTVGPRMAARKTGLIQLSDNTEILLIQISAMESFPYRLKASLNDLITSATILKVGVNIGADMKKLCRDFGTAYAARGVLDLSHLARAVDVGLVGTKMDDLDTSKAGLGVGIPKNLDPSQAGDATDVNMEDELSYEDNVQASTEIELETPAKKGDTNQLVRSGRKLISLARLVRRYLARELEKGDVRTSNWEKLLSTEQKQYAANDAHAGLALYYALQRLHSRSVAEGVIPIPSPPPWKGCALQHDMAETYFSGPRPAPPPFGAQATNRRATSEPKFVPINELQHLTPNQLESLIPWDSLIKDLQAEFEEARALVLVKRKKEGVDLHGRGEAVVAAAEAAPSLAHTSDSSNGAFSKNTVDNPLGDAYFDSPQPGNTRPQGKGMAYETRRRQARQATQNEVLGRQWPPTRVFTSRSTETLGLTPPSLAPTVSHPISEAEPSLDSDQPESQPQESTHPPIPSRGVSSPALSSGPRPQHLRAYLLWHKQQLPLPQICASLRSASYPLAKSTAISYIVQALQADEKLPFEETRLRDLMSLDTTSWVRENYKQFLESKIGSMDDNAS